MSTAHSVSEKAEIVAGVGGRHGWREVESHRTRLGLYRIIK